MVTPKYQKIMEQPKIIQPILALSDLPLGIKASWVYLCRMRLRRTVLEAKLVQKATKSNVPSRRHGLGGQFVLWYTGKKRCKIDLPFYQYSTFIPVQAPAGLIAMLEHEKMPLK